MFLHFALGPSVVIPSNQYPPHYVFHYVNHYHYTFILTNFQNITSLMLMRHTTAVATILTVIAVLLCSCGQNKDATVVHSGSRDNVTSVTLTSIDDALPMIHSDARFALCGDTLIIDDHKSTDKQFVAYDLSHCKYLGSFGMYGSGPGEIANFGGLFYDSQRGILYGLNLNKWQISGFNLREAVADSTYKAFTKVKFMNRRGGPINTPFYVNDTTIFCSVYVPDDTGMKLTSHVGKFNLLTGERMLLDSIDEVVGNAGLITVSPANDLMIETGVNHDRIRLYSLEGKLKKTIYGPDYSERYDGRAYYFSVPVVAGDKILAVYSGQDYRKNGTGHEILVMDLDGNYIKTLDVGARISSIVYHPKTDRVYVSEDDEPQFGYFNLSEALGETTSAKKEPKNVAEDVPADQTVHETDDEAVQESATSDVSSQGRETILDNGVKVVYSSPMAANTPKYDQSEIADGPLALLDPLARNFNPVDIATIGAQSDGDKGKKYQISLIGQGSEEVTIESIILPDARFKVDWNGIAKYKPGVLSTFTLKSEKAIELDDYRFILTYKGDKYPPQTFHISLHPDIYRLMEERDTATDQ